MSPTYRPPRDCPVCRHGLHTTQLGCPECGTAVSGDFEACEFCGLDDQDRDVLRVFLASKGNMKDLERYLGVSYPTARSRFDQLLAKLGIAESDADARGPAARPAPSEDDDRLATLQQLANGKLDIAEARARLE